MLERRGAVFSSSAQVIEELIQLAKDIRAAPSRGEESGSAEDVPTQGFPSSHALTSARG